MTNTELIIKDLQWLESQKTSNNIVQISQVLNHLAILTVRLGEEVAEAYQFQSEAEDTYDVAFAKRITELVQAGASAVSAKSQTEAELGDKKVEWTKMKVLYKKLNTFLERTDRVLEAYRQSVSVIKATDLKNI